MLGVVPMPVARLRTRRDLEEDRQLARLRGEIERGAGHGLPVDLARGLLHLIDRKRASRNGWSFILVEPGLFADVTAYLTDHSRRPLKAVNLWTRLFAYLPEDSNEVTATRAELARIVGITPADVSQIMGELEAIGAVRRERYGRGVRYLVHPALGTHLAGAMRDAAQACAWELKLPARVQGGGGR